MQSTSFHKLGLTSLVQNAGRRNRTALHRRCRSFVAPNSRRSVHRKTGSDFHGAVFREPHRLTVFLAAVGMLVCGVSRADVPPNGEPFVETCTLEQQHFNDTECFECTRDSLERYDGGVAPDGFCSLDESVYQQDGYKRKCKGGGEYIWPEVWCRSSPGTTGPAGDRKESGCSTVTPGRTNAITEGFVWLLLSFFIAF